MPESSARYCNEILYPVGQIRGMLSITRLFLFFFFFFSSRRRHTRFDCDWSSDVCSSDLMENQREDLVVILAGYKERMDTFFQSNPGFHSRVGHHLDFPDYTLEELMADRKSVV